MTLTSTIFFEVETKAFSICFVHTWVFNKCNCYAVSLCSFFFFQWHVLKNYSRLCI